MRSRASTLSTKGSTASSRGSIIPSRVFIFNLNTINSVGKHLLEPGILYIVYQVTQRLGDVAGKSYLSQVGRSNIFATFSRRTGECLVLLSVATTSYRRP